MIITNSQSFGFGATGAFLQNIKEGGQFNKTCKKLWNMIPTVQGHAYSRIGLQALEITPEDLAVLNTIEFNDTEARNFKMITYQPTDKHAYVLIFIPRFMIGYPIYNKEELKANTPQDHKLTVKSIPFELPEIENLRYGKDKQSLVICTTNKTQYVCRLEEDPQDHKLIPVLKPMDLESAPVRTQNIDHTNKVYATKHNVGETTAIWWTKDALKPGHVGSIWAFYEPPSMTTLWEANSQIAGSKNFVHYGENVYLKISGSDTTGHTPPAHNFVGEQASDGQIVWGFLNNGGGFAKCIQVIEPKEGMFVIHQALPHNVGLAVTDATVFRWNEPVFSDVRGHATACAFHEGRLILTGINRNMLNATFTTTSGEVYTRDLISKETSTGQKTRLELSKTIENVDVSLFDTFPPADQDASDTTIYGSKVGYYGNFDTLNASVSDAFSYTLTSDQQSGILWMISSGDLIIGTTHGIHIIRIITGNKIEIFDFIKDSLSRTLPGLIISDTVFYASSNNNCLKMLISNTEDGRSQNTSISDRAQELTTGIKDMCAYEADRNHVILLRENKTLTGMYFDSSDNVSSSGLYQIGFDPQFEPQAIQSTFIHSEELYPSRDTVIGNVLIVMGLLKFSENEWRIMVSYLDINQPPDIEANTYDIVYKDKFLRSATRDGNNNIIWEYINLDYTIEIEPHKQGFLNPGRAYGDLPRAVTVKKVDLNTWGTYNPPLINGKAPDNWDIASGQYDTSGALIPGSSAEIVYHYSLNEPNSKVTSVTQQPGKPLCVINMDMTIEGVF